MSFHEIRFLSELSKKAVGGPSFQTNIIELASGKEQRNINWQNARAKYAIAIKNLSNADAKKTLEFFYTRHGAAYGFRFKDWLDFEAVQQNIGTGNGVKTSFELIKNYTNNGINYTRRIFKPVENSAKIFVDGAQINSGFTVDYINGKIVFVTPPANGKIITTSFEFDVPVRFAADELKIAYDNLQNNSAKEIEFIEIKL